MSGFRYPGGIETIEFADAEDFDAATGNATAVVTVERNSIAKEGNSFPQSEAVVGALHDDREGSLGKDIPFQLRFTDMPVADVDQLEVWESGAEAGKEIFVRFSSMKKAADGTTPAFQTVYRRVILSHVSTSPVADRGSYGVVMVDGKTTGFTNSDMYTITETQ